MSGPRRRSPAGPRSRVGESSLGPSRRPPPPADPLHRALQRLKRMRAPARLAERLFEEADSIRDELAQMVRERIPAFGESQNADVLGQLAEHGARHASEIGRMLTAFDVGDLEFVREHARVRAEQFFPLEAVLHAYRCGHRVLGRRLMASAGEAAPPVIAAIADFALEYTDAISTIASSAYVDQVREMSAASVDEHAALLDDLLDGHDESDRRVSARLRKAGFLEGRQAYCVVLAQSVDPSHMRDAARARRLAEALDALVPASVARRLVDVRAGTVTMVLAAAARVSGWTRPLEPLSARVAAELALAGNDVLAGIGPDVEATGRIPVAHRQAALALQLAHVGRRVRRFDEIALRDLMIHQATPALRDLLPRWHAALRQADAGSAGTLAQTLRAYAATDMNVLKTAEQLGVHPNTVYARFERIRASTDTDPRSFEGLQTLLLVLDLVAVRAGP